MFFILIELLSVGTLYYCQQEFVEFICEGFIGVCDIIIIILAPLWIDQYGIQKHKTLLFILIELAIPFGRCIGFTLIFFISIQIWKQCLVLVLFLIFISFSFFAFFPYLYFSSKIRIETDLENKEIETKNKRSVSIFQINSRSSNFDDNKSLKNDIVQLIKNPIFICGIISKLFLIFLQTIFFFRISSYMSQVINLSSQLRTIYYLLILFIGPIGGVFLGVLITSSQLSYNKKHGGLCLLLLYILTCAFGQGMIIKKDDNLLFIVFAICLFMFCSSSISILQGILISSMNNELKGFGYSFSHLVTLIIGVGSALYIYDFLNLDKTDSNAAMKYVCYSLFVGLFFCILLIMFNYWKKPERENGMSKKRDQNEDIEDKKSRMSKIVEGLGQAYIGYAPNIEENLDEQLDKSYEKEVNLDEINDRFVNEEEFEN